MDVEWSDECLDDIMAIHTQLIRNTTLVYFHMADQAFEKEDYGASLRCIDRALHSYGGWESSSPRFVIHTGLVHGCLKKLRQQ